MKHLFRNILIPLVALAFGHTAQAADVKPNILWLSVEDIGPQLGCYGDPAAKTPNIDRLAKMGMLYETAWSNYPVCAPARTTIITGVYPAATGGGHMRSSRPLPKSIRMYPQYLRDAGYYCTNNSKEDYNHPKPGKVWDASSRRAHYKNGKEGKPFFAIFNGTMTHESRIRRKPHTVKTDVSKIRLPKYYPDIPLVRRDWGQYYDNINTMDGWIGKKLDDLKAAGKSENTIVVFFGDHGSGMPRHKRYPGDSGLRVPFIVYVPPKLRHLAPSDYKPGGKSKRLVGFIDLAPTMLSLAGVKPPEHMHGHAFMGKHAVAGPDYLYGFRGRMDERPDLVRSLRDGRYLYLRNYMPYRPHGQHVAYQFQTRTTSAWHSLYKQGKLNAAQRRFWQRREAEELYDLKTDPDEIHNLAHDPEHRKTLERFRHAHRRKTLEIRDVVFLPEATLESIGQSERTPYEFGRDRNRYNLEQILTVADEATRRDPASLSKLLAYAKSTNATIRYWAATGLLVRGKSAVAAHRTALRQLLNDKSGPVAVVAAEALARYSNAEDRKAAVQTLGKLADLKNGSYFTAVAALNAINALGDRASGAHASLANVPTVDPKVKRAKNYIPRLIQTITDR